MRDEDNEQGLVGHSVTLTNPRLRGSGQKEGHWVTCHAVKTTPFITMESDMG